MYVTARWTLFGRIGSLPLLGVAASSRHTDCLGASMHQILQFEAQKLVILPSGPGQCSSHVLLLQCLHHEHLSNQFRATQSGQSQVPICCTMSVTLYSCASQQAGCPSSVLAHVYWVPHISSHQSFFFEPGFCFVLSSAYHHSLSQQTDSHPSCCLVELVRLH
ncbi:hypothetical protein AALO_G00161430 [Alosa alosa]|uniref:Secreted protein n=1 Tax=Alosa alosa TaxID=278164 RepID=A0AAV6GC19_9TELE|nr:hypothetical protein AALO_G00161430 [Alosa alosa]